MDTNDAVQTAVEPVAEQKPVEPKPTDKPVEKTEPKKDTPKPDNAEVEKLKEALSRANSQAADYKRQLREKQTEQERAEAERLEAEKAKDARLAELERTVAITDYTNKCLALDFDAELATQTANAFADGNMESVFDCLKQFVEATKTKLANEALNRQPPLSAGTPPTSNNIDTETEQLRHWMGAPNYRK